ncbi:zinc ABC transporter substrate-binding protein [Rhodovulum sp. YNF3179]|uniref:zinc ABC transporter substrate-binding protein n=1 Tax=Rhodovulum sp. YNF3179 TaxID=3425127 RepID=UPI003D33CBD0
MKPLFPVLASFSVFFSGAVAADPPRVVADIPPIHALTARVMEGVADPDLLLRPGASPHDYAMRPSEARALSEADIVFWVGPVLTPWLDEALDTLGGTAEIMTLSETPGLARLEMREGATFEAHDHDHAHDDDDHGHDDDDDHAHDDHAHDDHGHDDDHDTHDHGAIDPHLWLDPANAALWLNAIAAALSAADPENADTYRSNAALAEEELEALVAETDARLAPVRGLPFVVFHDAYHYFEARFDIEAAGAVSVSDATDPGPRRVAEIRDLIRDTGAACVFTEPQFPPRLVDTLIEGSTAQTGTLDPLGADLAPGAKLYPALIRGLADGMIDCLGTR